jgi:anti-sigma regulatory factor (Ser/Thr protein kinase)/ActR/RegA family two-component response regulator
MGLSEKPNLGGNRDHPSESRVLLIGHDGDSGGSLEEQLTSLHCSIGRAAGSCDALRQLRDVPYTVVVTDPRTSIQEDLALIDEIRGVRPGARVIVLAQSGTPEDIIAALRQRVFLCQVAPFNAGEIAKYAVSAMETDNSLAGIEVLSADRDWISVRMNSDQLNADRLTEFFKQFQMTLPERPPEELMIAFEEILQNAIEHGAQNDPSKQLQVAAIRTARAFVFYISDPGKGFRWDSIPHAVVSHSPSDMTRHIEIREKSGMRPGGFGILVASGIVDEMIYSEVGNEVLLIKHKPAPEARRSGPERSWNPGEGNDLMS